MKTTDYVKLALQNSAGWVMGLLNDMKDAPLTQPTPNGGNHPLWVLGHLTHSESNLLDKFILGKPNRFPELEAQFAMGTAPTTDASAYPSFEELLGKWETMRAATVAHLESLTEAKSDKPSLAPEEFGPGFSTVAGVYTAMSTHVAFHCGQVADARRAAGREVLVA